VDRGSAAPRRLSPIAFAIAGGVTVLLICFAYGYGYHRDELYFLAAGRHLSFGYPDQGPLTPWLAHVFGGGTITLLRLPSAIAAGGVVLTTAAIAAELGANRRDQCVAEIVIASSGLVLFVGHTLSTSTFDLLVWSALSYLIIRAIRTESGITWLLAGVVLGIGLLNKPLPAFLAAALLLGLVACGPRRVLRSWGPWAGAVLGAALWLPWLVWQSQHGWPEFDVARSIANGGSTSSQPWWVVVPYQALLAGPPLVAVWIAGLVRLARHHTHRYLAVAWAVLAIVFMATGGKPYYLAGFLPLLVAAGVPVALRWLTTRTRAVVAVTAVIVTAVPDLVIALPMLPASHASVVVSLNPDVGETLGWPRFIDQIRAVYRPGDTIVTANYGEAGAIDRLGSSSGLPPAYSGHNAFSEWGPPAAQPGRVLLLGDFPESALSSFVDCTIASRISTGFSNEENGVPIRVCSGPRRPWSVVWPRLLHYG
jgi:hypothetical protein